MPSAPKRVPTLKELHQERAELRRRAKTGARYSERVLRSSEPHDLRHALDIVQIQLTVLFELMVTRETFSEHEFLSIEVDELRELVSDYQEELGTGVTLG